MKEKTDNNNTYVAPRILIVMVLTGVMLLWGCGQREEFNTGTQITDQAISDGVYADESDEEAEADAAEDTLNIVIDGFRMTVPSDYDCFYEKGVGPVISMDGVFEMKIEILEDSMEEILQDPTDLTKKTIDEGAILLKRAKETKLDGKKFVYFQIELEGVKCVVVYTQAADTDMCIRGQIVMESDSLSEEELLQIFAVITTSAQETDEPNTTMKDLESEE